ncbi:hypothetical protein QOT17_002486 [Balamuthia mandrillaris]
MVLFSLEIWLALALVLLAWAFWTAQWRPSGSPPGPYRLPLLGNLLSLGGSPHLRLRAMACRFGPIFSLQLGCRFAVVLSDSEVITEALQRKGTKTAGRPSFRLFEVVSQGEDMAMVSYGVQWRILRKLAHGALFNRARIAEAEPAILTQVSHLLRHFHNHSTITTEQKEGAAQPSNKEERAAFYPHALLKRFGMSVIGSLTFGRDLFEAPEQDFVRLQQGFDFLFKVGGTPDPADYFPSLAGVLPNTTLKKVKSIGSSVLALLEGSLADHKKKLDPHHPKDFVDQILIHREKDEVKEKESFLDDARCSKLLFDLFTAGTDTSSTVIEWFLAFMCCFPEVQRKIHAELDEKIKGRRNGEDEKGEEVMVKLKDKKELPYLSAALLEALRFRPPAILSLPHVVMEEVQVAGYVLPKGTLIITNLFAAMMDEKIFEQPEKFVPERFLEDPQLDEKVIAFGVGPRQCPGMLLAEAELFLAIANLMLRFSFVAASSSKYEKQAEPSLDGVFGLTLQPAPFPIRVLARE